LTTQCEVCTRPVTPILRERIQSKSMFQGKEILISGGKLTHVGGDYHEHITIYVIDEAPTYLKTLQDKVQKLETISSPKEDSSRQTMHSPSRVESDTSSSNHSHGITEIHFNSLNDPPQTTSVFDDGYCIYDSETFTPSMINDSRTFSAMAQDDRNLPSGNQHSYPFVYMPFLVPGIVHYLPYWLPSWGW